MVAIGTITTANTTTHHNSNHHHHHFFPLYILCIQAVPFSTLCALILLWFGISLPLVLVGSYFGFKKEVFEVPVRTNQTARHVPEQVTKEQQNTNS